VKIQEAEGQIITDYHVCPTRVPDKTLWVLALERHHALFGYAPRLAVADAGFASAANERAARELGVTRVVLPRRGAMEARRPAAPRQRWYRRGLRWRPGSEGRISIVKRSHGLRRCRYRGAAGMERWVGLGIIASQLAGTRALRRHVEPPEALDEVAHVVALSAPSVARRAPLTPDISAWFVGVALAKQPGVRVRGPTRAFGAS